MTDDPVTKLMDSITYAKKPSVIDYFRRKTASARIGVRRARQAALQRLVTRTMKHENEGVA